MRNKAAVLALAVTMFCAGGANAASDAEAGKSALAKLELRQARTEARDAIENIMGRLVFYRLAEMEYKVTEFFANGDPGLKIQIPPGIYAGPDAAKRLFGDPNMQPPAPHPGEMHYHTLVTPVIEVAGDGKTAKALWMSPGAVSQERNGAMVAQWSWTKYAADFKQVNGAWKIWHFRVMTVFDAPYGTAWTEAVPRDPPKPPPAAGPDADAKPKGPPRPDRPNPQRGGYSLSTVQQLVPAPPVPYETWDDSMSYVQ